MVANYFALMLAKHRYYCRNGASVYMTKVSVLTANTGAEDNFCLSVSKAFWWISINLKLRFSFKDVRGFAICAYCKMNCR